MGGSEREDYKIYKAPSPENTPAGTPRGQYHRHSHIHMFSRGRGKEAEVCIKRERGKDTEICLAREEMQQWSHRRQKKEESTTLKRSK